MLIVDGLFDRSTMI